MSTEFKSKIKLAMDRARLSIARDAARELSATRMAEIEVAAHVGPLDMAFDSAAAVYAHGLKRLGYTKKLEHPSIARPIFKVLVGNAVARQRLAQDRADPAGFAKRYPNARPAKTV